MLGALRTVRSPIMITSTDLPDLDTTLVVAVEISKSTWLTAAHIPGLPAVKAKQPLKATGEALVDALERLRRRAAAKKHRFSDLSSAMRLGMPGSGWPASFNGRASRCR
jgi:hypothetical protein